MKIGKHGFAGHVYQRSPGSYIKRIFQESTAGLRMNFSLLYRMDERIVCAWCRTNYIQMPLHINYNGNLVNYYSLGSWLPEA